MGRGGIDPLYFLDEMTWVEILLYLKGLNDRDRSIYDSMRILAANVLSGIGAKMKDGTDIQPSAIYKFQDEVKQKMVQTAKDAVAYKERLVKLLQQCNAENKSARKHATE